MIFISHRGNIDGRVPAKENEPNYVTAATHNGYDVEIDVWFTEGNWFLGHDAPQYPIEEHFLQNEKFWCHAKNLDALARMLSLGVKCFWHQKDDYTITSNGLIWAYPGLPLSPRCVCVMPELTSISPTSLADCAGICSDHIKDYKL